MFIFLVGIFLNCLFIVEAGKVVEKEGNFYLDGEKWNALGINYFPSGFNHYENPKLWIRENKYVDSSIHEGKIQDIYFKDQVTKELDKLVK